MKPSISQKIRYYYNQRDLLRNYVRRDLRERYMGSLIGFYWSAINPLILLGIYTFVFSVILQVRFGPQQGIAGSALYIFCGMVPWMTFQESVGRSTGVLIDNANLIKKVMFPAKILPAYIVISHFVNLGIGLTIMIIAAALAGHGPSLHLLWLPVIAGAQFVFTLGCCWLVSALNVFVRDTAPLTAQLLTVWMFLSPIFYSIQLVPEPMRPLLIANPITHLVTAYRDVVLDTTTPDLVGLGMFSLAAVGVAGLGYLFFTRSQHLFSDVL